MTLHSMNFTYDTLKVTSVNEISHIKHLNCRKRKLRSKKVIRLIYIIYDMSELHSLMMGATSGAGTAYPSVAPEFIPGF